MYELLKRFIGPYKVKTVVGVLVKMVEVVFECLTPLVVARMIDDGVARGDTDEIVRLGLLLLVFAAVSYCFTLVCQKMAAIVSQGVGTDLRNAMYDHVNDLSSEDIDSFGTASLVTRVTNDTNQVQVTLALLIRQVTRWPILAIGSIAGCLLIDMRLGLINLVCTPLCALVFYFAMSRALPYYRAMQAKLDKISLVTREALSGVRVIRAFRRESHEEERFRDAAYDQAGTAIAAGKLASILSPATLVVMDLGIVGILWQGGISVNLGELTQGNTMAVINYMMTTLTAVSYLANLVILIMRGQASSRRIIEVLDAKPSITDAGNKPVALPERGTQAVEVPAIQLQDVGFRYKGAGRDALSGVSFSVPAGGTIGVIGGTGSGKSTLANLLPRLYDATTGYVSVFGTDVREYPFSQLRHLVSIVPQQTSLTSGTIRSNLSWRNPDASEKELWDALDIAQASDFVRSKPDGLDTVVDAGGKNFSGGQRQRLTIARALVGDPSVIVLDDSASALDFATDARLRASLARLAPRLTSVIISQRVSAVMGADQILVLDHGAMAGLGTHHELLKTCPLYREICLSQLRREEVER